jgi:threonine dehydratase
MLQRVKEAQNRLDGVVLKTSITTAPILSKKLNSNIYLKKENLQLTGSFKLRGAFNKVASLSNEQRESGVIAASAGNHAQGVAFSANYFKIDATIVMPEATPLTKISGVKSFGAKVVLFGNNYDEAYAHAKELAQKSGYTFIHPFSDDEVIAGQGTIGLEILDALDDIDMVIAPVGGGGLISGVALAIKSVNPNIKVVGVTSSGADAMYQSYHNNRLIDSLSVRTIADGIAVRDTDPKTFKLIKEYVDDVVQVDDNEIANAILFLLENQKLVVEGAGAVGVAAIMHNKIDIESKKVAVILSGGNIDVTMLSVIIEKGLIKSNRKMKMSVTLIDKPGSLESLTKILNEVNANIVQIDYDRTSINLNFGDAYVTLALETKGEEHQDLIREKLLKNGFIFKELI